MPPRHNKTKPDTFVLLDVSRLVWRAWRGQLPTGIDRACLAYVEHYRGRALAVLQRGGFTRVLGQAKSDRLFSLLLDQPPNFRAQFIFLIIGWALGKNVAAERLDQATYLNVGHTGLDRAGHLAWVGRHSLRAFYYVHDLIPVTYPQFPVKESPSGMPSAWKRC